MATNTQSQTVETGYLLEDPLPPSYGRVVNTPDGPVDPREPPHIHYVNEMRNPPHTQNRSSLAHSNHSGSIDFIDLDHDNSDRASNSRRQRTDSNLDAYIYLMFALILSVLFSFTGILIFVLFCTVPAAICAKQAINAGNCGEYGFRRARANTSFCCSIIGCVTGSFFACILFGSVVIVYVGRVALVAVLCFQNFQESNSWDNCTNMFTSLNIQLF